MVASVTTISEMSLLNLAAGHDLLGIVDPENWTTS